MPFGVRALVGALAVAVGLAGSGSAAEPAKGKSGDDALGTRRYEDYEKPRTCATCHVDIAREYEQAMMSQAFVHAWDEIEYFELALPQAEKEPKVAGVKAGCNGCHAPLAFLAGDIPPKRPSANTRANEAVSCDFCHTVTGRGGGDAPVNYDWISEPGKTKQGNRKGVESPYHVTRENAFFRSTELCGTCHNEKSPWGAWVKSTQLEWKESPQARGGIVCQDCHMPPAKGRSARVAPVREDVRQHLFHGAHDPGKLAGVAEVRVHAEAPEVDPGDPVRITAVVVNAKAGHKIPTGSAEERVLWLHVEARDAKGEVHHLRVDRKGFPDEAYTIADPKALAYQDIGDIRGIEGFPGLPRDGEVPEGDRIFRLPYLDPKGRMTIAQWNTARLATDYRIAPLQAVAETFTWEPRRDLPPGPVTVTATVWYSRLVSSVAEFMKVPREESAPVLVSRHETTFAVRR